MTNQYKTGGPETDYVIAAVRCCRIWPIITATLTWDPKIEMMKRESWWLRECGLCGKIPRPVEEDRPYERT